MLIEPKCHPELMKMGKRNAIVGLDDGFKASGVKDGDEWMQITST